MVEEVGALNKGGKKKLCMEIAVGLKKKERKSVVTNFYYGASET